MSEIRPCDVHLSRFVGSSFGDAQMEMFLQCIAITQFKMNPDQWTPFSWEEYVGKCDHEPIQTELEILDAMVEGGDVVLDDMGIPKNIYVDAGYLSKDGDRYVITSKLLNVMSPHARNLQ